MEKRAYKFLRPRHQNKGKTKEMTESISERPLERKKAQSRERMKIFKTTENQQYLM